jgi:hypothetical protein
MRTQLLILTFLVLPNSTGCGLIIAHNAIQRHYDVRDREVEYRHQERMKELELQKQQIQQQQPPPPIVREVPF